MIYILGVNISNNKPIYVGLSKIYGIGPNITKSICNKLYINPLSKPYDLMDKQINKLAKFINKYKIEIDLKKAVNNDIERLISLGTYRGLRHKLGLPVRGQRTRSNARTQRLLSKKMKLKLKIKSINFKSNQKKTIKKK